MFDLDNTLYRADSGVFAHIDARMTRIRRRFSGAGATTRRARVQKTLYREHGTTLNGLIKLHGIDPEPYLDFVHQIDLSDLQPDAGAGLRHRKIAGPPLCLHQWLRPPCGAHSGAAGPDPSVPRYLGYPRPWALCPSPMPAAYRRIVAHGGFAPGTAAMFDDIARNLVEAHALGMTTVWLNTDAVWDRQGPEFPVASALHIDHETKDLTQFLNRIRI